MINGVSSSQNDYFLTVTKAKRTENAANEEPERSDEEKVGYKLSLSDENWETFGKKKEQSEEELSKEELRQVEELKKIDKRVHTHEQAHLSAAGGYARGGAHYDYVMGPDGNKYANAGHVNLDTGREKPPEATIRKANIIQKAALAPADPSPADREIAANAAKMAEEAKQELAEEQRARLKDSDPGSKSETEIQQQNDTPDAPQETVSEATS